MADYEKDVERLGALAPVVLALVEYAKALVPGAEFIRKGRGWVCQPKNYVAFEVHATRTRNVTFTVHGLPRHFDRCPALPLWGARSGYYSGFRVESPRQLAAAAAYIATAAHLHKYARKRTLPSLPDLPERL